MLRFLKSKWTIAAVVVALIAAGYFIFFRSGNSGYQFVTVTRGSVAESVSVTGNTVPEKSVSLGFGIGGTVSGVFAEVGDRVSDGAVLAVLDTADLSAQLKQAQANVDAENAKLAGLKAGSRPEDIAAALAAYHKSLQDLANYYASVSDTETDSYAKALDAVKTQLSPLFSNADTGSPTLTFSTDSQKASNAQSSRVSAGKALSALSAALPALSNSSPQALDAAITSAGSNLSVVRDFLDTVSGAVQSASNLSQSTLDTYKDDVTAAITETNTAIKNLNTLSQNIASQKITVQELKAQYDLKQAGSTPEDIAAQQAAVNNAEAAVESIEAKLRNARIVAPQSGVVTQFDAKTGEIATAGVTLVSIISDQKFEVDADVPETDIGKVSVGNEVSMTLDAFPGETMTGKVFYIDPAETVTSGVVNYKVKVSFDKPDPRMKSGLTANLEIQTRKKDGVLILPEYAILTNDQGTFVEVLENGAVKDVPVTLGLEDAEGNTEIVSGVTAGEEVLNIGLKRS